MSKTQSFILSGFGGQGLLFAGKVIAYAGLHDGREVSWLPSYGPEMRGGTANCTVVLSDEPIGSPMVGRPDLLMALNLPSFDRFERLVVPGGVAVVDSSLVERRSERTDIAVYYIPATKLANERGLHGGANMIALGKLLRETGFVSMETLLEGLKKSMPARKEHLYPYNVQAIELGYHYGE